MEVASRGPVAPGATVRFRRVDVAHPARRRVGRAGWVHDYHFVVQWFPKIAALLQGPLERAHLPSLDRVLLGLRRLRRAPHPAPGLRRRRHGPAGRDEGDNADGTETLRFVQEDVHDFAWTASRRFLERSDALRGAGLPAGRHPAAGPARARAPRRSLPRGHEDALRGYGRGRRPTPTRRSRWSIRPGTPPRAAWSTRRSSPRARTSGPRPPCRARERDHPRRRPPVLVRARGQQRVRGGLARRGPQPLLRRQDGVRSARARRVRAPLLRARRRPRSRSGWPVVAPGVWIGRGKANLADLADHGQGRRDGATPLGLPRRPTPTP